MTLDPEITDGKFKLSEFIDPSVTGKDEADQGLLTYKRRCNTTKRKISEDSSWVKLWNESRSKNVEEVNSRKGKSSRVFAAPQKRRKLFDMWKISRTPSPLVSNMGTKKAVAPKVKRAAGQYFLDLGQKDFSYSTCPVCGLFYARGLEDDEAVHKVFHRNRTKGISCKGWQDERVVRKIGDKGDRIILVLPDDTHHRQKVKEVMDVVEAELGLSPGWLTQKACKVYLYISSSKKIVGCLMVEPIKTAYKLLPTKKQEYVRASQQVPLVQEENSSVAFGEDPNVCETTTSTGSADPLNSTVEDSSDMSVQAGDQNSAGTSKAEACIPETALAGKAGREIPSSEGVDVKVAAAKPSIRKITDFFELRSIPPQTGKENGPANSAASPRCSPPSYMKTERKEGLTSTSCLGPRPSKLPEFFVGARSWSDGGCRSLEEPAKVGLTSLREPDQRQEELKPPASTDHIVKVESSRYKSGQVQVKEEAAEEGENNTRVTELAQRSVIDDGMDEQKFSVNEGSVKPSLQAKHPGFRQEGLSSYLRPKLEVKEETVRGFHDGKDTAELIGSRAAGFASGKIGVQGSMKNEDTPTELGGVQGCGEEEGDDSSVKASVQRTPMEPVGTGAKFLWYGNVKFTREVISRKRLRQEDTEELGSAIVYNSTPIPAVCGVRVIWVSNSERQKGVASHLLDTMRTNFCLGVVLDPSQFAFSQPTTDGRKFAARYCKTDEFLVYTTS
ncbi:hypothetical protein R1sor_018602 [Riccia sorocarpa]|uniref:N-acetyltransferase ESCO2 n=1 Tax=Riccia sorocarpa TaxID=122646 RepID=A0ABD3IDW4_9MARC